MRKRHQRVDAGQNIPNHLVGGVEIILGDEILNLAKINRRFRVEIVAGHEPGGARRAALFSRNRAITSPPEMGFILPLFRSS